MNREDEPLHDHPRGAFVLPLDARARAVVLWLGIGALLLVALVAGGAALARDVYSAEAFAARYLSALERGDASGALAIPGVRPGIDDRNDSDDRNDGGTRTDGEDNDGTRSDRETRDGIAEHGPQTSTSHALLRSDTLPRLDTVSAQDIGPDAAGRHRIRATISNGDVEATSTFLIERAGSAFGVIPRWRFAISPTAPVELHINNTSQLSINETSFEVAQLTADPKFRSVVHERLFLPGLYEFASADSSASAAPQVVTISQSQVPTVVTIDAKATDHFSDLVATEVRQQLDACAQQRALFPDGCPFGFAVEDRIDGEPDWTIMSYPRVEVVPGRDGWSLAPSTMRLEISLSVRSLFDGSVRDVREAVAVGIGGSVSVDGDEVTVNLTER